MEKILTERQYQLSNRKSKIDTYNMFFTERLKELREDKNLTQKELASKLNIPVSTYANWEQGRREPSIYDIFNILDSLEIEANELFDSEAFFNIDNIKKEQ